MNEVLLFDSVAKRFGGRAVLDGLSLSLGAGDVFALLGPNGAGKTTTLNLALGFIAPDAGHVRVCGQDVTTYPIKARGRIAYLPEQLALYPELSGLDNLRYFTLLAGLDLPSPDLGALLASAGLPAEAHRQPARAYSKGMRQKVGVAIALARDVRLLLLDEPTSGLDPAAASELSRIVRAAANRGVTVLMATHDLYRVKEVADRVGVMHRGRIVREVDPKRLNHLELEQLYIEQLGLMKATRSLTTPHGMFVTELRRLSSQPRVRWIAAAMWILIALVFLSSCRDAARLAADRAAVTAAERQRWLQQEQKDPHEAAHYGVWAIKPSSPLAILDPGVEPFLGLAVWLEAHQWDEMIFRSKQDADPLARSATSVGQILALLGPLVACLLGFAGFAEDRERGTLRMALGNGAQPGRLLVSRGSALLTILLATVIVPAVLLGGVAILTLSDSGWNSWIRLASWCGIHTVYVATFLLVALAVSLRARSARLALATLAAVWVVACFVLPRVATHLADAWSPLPSYQDVRARAETEAPVYENYDQWEARRQAILAAWGVTEDADAPVNVRGAQLDQAERHSHDVFDRLIGGFHDRVDAQDRLFGRLGMLSPAVALQSVSTAVAGTDFHQHRHFVNAAESYRRALVNRINGEVMRHDVTGSERYEEGAEFWANLAPLAYRPPALAGVVAEAAIPLFALALWCAAAAAAAVAALRGLQP